MTAAFLRQASSDTVDCISQEKEPSLQREKEKVWYGNVDGRNKCKHKYDNERRTAGRRYQSHSSL